MSMFVTVNTKEIKGLDVTEEVRRLGLVSGMDAWLNAKYPDWTSWTLVHVREDVYPRWYVYTLDSHECFGPFVNKGHLEEWANATSRKSYQVLTEPKGEARDPWPKGWDYV